MLHFHSTRGAELFVEIINNPKTKAPLGAALHNDNPTIEICFSNHNLFDQTKESGQE